MLRPLLRRRLHLQWPGLLGNRNRIKAADPFKALTVEVVFYAATQLVAHETIAFAAGQCVGYHKSFAAPAATGPNWF